jgi:hypothetical protein
VAGEPLRVVVVSDTPPPGPRLVGSGPSGLLALQPLQRGGPPYWWFAQLDSPAAGRHRFALLDAAGASVACEGVRVRARAPGPEAPSTRGWWPVRRSWNRVTENLYAAWIEKLFDAPPTERPSWIPLHAVLRDPKRNLLYNHLGAREDGPRGSKAVVVKPDCADLPFFLRAYYAWKMRLPFAHRHCSRGNSRRAATCGELRSIRSIPLATKKFDTPAERFSYYIRRNVSYVHSGCGRTGPGDDDTDLYPVALSRASLRPGTVYVDPYGHLLVVSRWINQTPGSSGQLFAVDGHPDLSVGRKRFWRGAFLFSDNVKGSAGGFKAFRPLVLRDGGIAALTNAEINKRKDYGNYSDEQYKNGIDGFYDRMDRIINPRPLSPLQAMRERLKALYELILERVDSVKAGEDYMRRVGYKEMKMPGGPRIFETRGPWEDFSTPARDFRLLIAIDEVLGFPGKVVADPGRFTLKPGDKPEAARKQMLALITEFTRGHGFAYTRSDGSQQKLSMAQLLQRKKGLEMAYNPNDCVEKRWAASGAELSTCRRHAPEHQQRLMKKFRPWFATRNRPPIR